MANAGAMQDESAFQLLVGSACELAVGYFRKVDQSDWLSLALRVRFSQRQRPTARPPISLAGSSLPPGETHACHASPARTAANWQLSNTSLLLV